MLLRGRRSNLTRRTAVAAVTVAAVAVASAHLAGCGTAVDDDGAAGPSPLMPVATPNQLDDPDPDPDPEPEPEPDPGPDASTAGPGDASATRGSTDPDDQGATQQVGAVIVAEALDRYDSALTAVAADPVGATVAGDPRIIAWLAAVSASSPLHADVLRPLVTDAATDGVVVTPDGHPYSWRHVVTGASAPEQGRISFTWCGWSPGVVRRGAGGAVLDDDVGISSGVGELVLGVSWQVDSLEQMELSAHPPGTADPCVGAAP